MANHQSAKKRARQTIKRTERNRFYRTRIKNLTRAVREAVESGDQEQAAQALKNVNKNFHAYVSKGVLKKKTVSRKVSRLAKIVNDMSKAA